MDKDGNVVIKPKYEKIYQFGEFQEDWALVEIGGLFGFVDKDGNEVVKPVYEKMTKDMKLETETTN
ncbi:WG repeat-containing protein [Cyclobacterium xiamenense]|uniref:WG repeat-containing protein n=1 Tax=Cyclobacterium xiamenense TaxID=1297121 RepID=UPI0015A6E527|nr:WG repeat-containing protein [Cyclobacterium xiamenense]